MPRNLEILIIYLTALMQGLALVALPAASSVFTDSQHFNFSTSQYGTLFIPQVLMSILAAFLAPRLSLTWGKKSVYQVGIVLNIISMGLMALSQLFVRTPSIAYGCLFFSTTAMGAAFGTTLPMINVYAQRFFPQNPAGALTGLHTLLGTGTAIAPLLVIVLVKGAGWWLMPLGSFLILALILLFSFSLPLKAENSQTNDPVQKKKFIFSNELKLFMLIVFLYGFCETIFSNWSIIYLSKEKSVSVDEAGYALSIFWAMVTGGRLLTSLLSTWVAPSWFYRILPIIIAIALWMVTTIHNPTMGIIYFGLAGLACSAFFPLTFSFAQSRNPASAELVSGFLMAFYMLGYGFGSYGIGMMMPWLGISLQGVYQASIAVAIGVIILSFILTKQKQP